MQATQSVYAQLGIKRPQSVTPTASMFVFNQNIYRVYRGNNGELYVHDPFDELPGPYVATTRFGLGEIGLSGSTDTALKQISSISAFAAPIPVVGPIIAGVGSIIGAAESLFGGGDPTPASALWASVINLREEIAQANNQLAGKVVDTFTLPPGLDPTSDGDYPKASGLSAIIVSQVLGLSTTDRHKVKRASYYQAIQQMQSQLQQLQQQLGQQQQQAQNQAQMQSLFSAFTSAFQSAIPASQQASQSQIGTQASVASGLLPSNATAWIFPAAALLLYLTMS